MNGAVDGACHRCRPAVTSMRYGAFDYITKPFTSSDLVQVARRAFGEDGATAAKPNRGTEVRLAC